MEKRSGNLKTNFSEIARELGISRVTVYRVVNQSPLVAPATRTRVLEVLNRHGYYTHRRIRHSRICFDFCQHLYLTEMGEILMKRLPESEYILYRTDHRRNTEEFFNTVSLCDAVVFCSIPEDPPPTYNKDYPTFRRVPQRPVGPPIPPLFLHRKVIRESPASPEYGTE